MSLPNLANKCYGTVLRGHYEKFLYPYDLFESGAATDPKVQAILAQQQAAKRSPNKKVGDNSNYHGHCSCKYGKSHFVKPNWGFP